MGNEWPSDGNPSAPGCRLFIDLGLIILVIIFYKAYLRSQRES